jgi:hypothetical protein
VRLLPPEEELLLARPRLDELDDRLREPELDRLRALEPLEPLEPLERFEPLDRLRDELPELPDRLFDPDDEARPRERLELDWELLPERDRLLPLSPLLLCWSSSSLPLPSSFLPTATAAGTATPMAAPAATFFPVDMPSFSSISLISTSFSCRWPR